MLTTGSTANACARALKRAGAARVELVSWARVVQAFAVDALMQERVSVARVEIYIEVDLRLLLAGEALLDAKGVEYQSL